jgi:hypothetical protein
VRRVVAVLLVGLLSVPAAFVAVSYPVSLVKASRDREMCPKSLHSYPGSTTVEQCIKSRQDRRWGPWEAWGSNAPEED